MPLHPVSPSLTLTGAVGCMTAAMGNWRRKAVASGLRPMTTESHRARSSAVSGHPIQTGSHAAQGMGQLVSWEAE